MNVTQPCNRVLIITACIAGMMTILGGCSTAPRTETGRTNLKAEAAAVLAEARRTDATIKDILDVAQGYAVFPTVGKGGALVGGAYGKGVLYERGEVIGFCDLKQASIGLQLGGQAYTEIIAFETDAALERFKSGNFAFAAQATAVALTAGAGANADYDNGVLVFTMGEAGLMYEASIGGQKFSYRAE